MHEQESSNVYDDVCNRYDVQFYYSDDECVVCDGHMQHDSLISQNVYANVWGQKL